MAEVGGVKDPVGKRVAEINGLISKEWIFIRIGPPALVGDDLVLIPK